jgi:hypothetical protein
MLNDAENKRKELLCKSLPQNPTIAEICDTLQDLGCLIDADGKISRLLGERDDAPVHPVLGVMKDPYLDFNAGLIPVIQKVLKWLSGFCHGVHYFCVGERIKIIHSTGLRGGGSGLWLQCLYDLSIEIAELDNESERGAGGTSIAFFEEGSFENPPPSFYAALRKMVDSAIEKSKESGQRTSNPSSSKPSSAKPSTAASGDKEG